MRYLVLIILIAVTFTVSRADTHTWIGGTSSNWNTASNWTGGLPSNGDDIIIDLDNYSGNNPPIISANLAFDPDDITIRDGGELQMTGGSLNIDNINVETNGILNLSGGSLDIDILFLDVGNFTQSGGTFIVDEEIELDTGVNNFSVSGGTLNAANDIEIYSNNNVFTFSGTADINIADDFDFHDTQGNTINLSGNADLDVDELVEFDGTAGTSNQFNLCDDSTATFSDGSDLANDNLALPNFSVKDNATLNLGALPPVLPVSLLFFSGIAGNNEIEINWSTATEIENDHFELSKSLNGSDFYLLSEISGNGNSTQRIDYQFIDDTPTAGVNFYQLKQVDYDGTSEYFDIIAVQYGSNINDLTALKVWPNPNSGTNIKVALTNQHFVQGGQISLIDLHGKTIIKRSILEGVTYLELDRREFNIGPGMYFITYQDAFNKFQTRLSLQ